MLLFSATPSRTPIPPTYVIIGNTLYTPLNNFVAWNFIHYQQLICIYITSTGHTSHKLTFLKLHFSVCVHVHLYIKCIYVCVWQSIFEFTIHVSYSNWLIEFYFYCVWRRSCSLLEFFSIECKDYWLFIEVDVNNNLKLVTPNRLGPYFTSAWKGEFISKLLEF